MPKREKGGVSRVMWMRPSSSLDTQSSLCSWMSELWVLRAASRLQTVRPPCNSRLQTLRPSKRCRLHTQSSLLTNAHVVQASGKRCVHASMEKEAVVHGEGGACVSRRRHLCATCASSQVWRRRHLSAARFSTCTQKHTLKPLNTRRDSKTQRTVSHSELNFYRSNMHGAGKAF